jgi:hypothetical protein
VFKIGQRVHSTISVHTLSKTPEWLESIRSGRSQEEAVAAHHEKQESGTPPAVETGPSKKDNDIVLDSLPQGQDNEVCVQTEHSLKSYAQSGWICAS